MSEKQKLRKKFLAVRSKITSQDRKKASRKILKYLLSLQIMRGSNIVGLYASTGSEVETRSFIRELNRLKYQVCLPKVSAHNSLKFYQVQSLKDCLPGKFKILEPKEDCSFVGIKNIEVVLVPGIVFDLQGHRLGYGKGFYDRLLKKIPEACRVGLSYKRNIVDELPVEDHDCPVDYIVSEDGILTTHPRCS